MKRFRDYGFKVGILNTGPKNTITDVGGVLVGHFTKIEGEDVRTGITIIDPGIKDLFSKKLPAAISVGNGAGKIAGSTQIEELGTIEAPIGLTNTLAVGPVTRGLIEVVIQNTPGVGKDDTVNVFVGETNDGFLNDIHKDSLSKKDVLKAYASRSPNFLIGNVGAGTGIRSFSFKSGMGTASRVIEVGENKYTLGVLTQPNFRGELTILGVPVGHILEGGARTPLRDNGSCMIVIATDAPLTSRQLKRVAKRAFFGMVRTGSVMLSGSGDYAIAFSTSRIGLEASGEVGRCLEEETLSKFFYAVADAVEESIYDSLFAAEALTGRDGNSFDALPKDKVVKILKENGR
ncbi:MAG: P1 family peptidase [Candidatus Liptonbacteria bacterium]|nr:P1 family peptidase [Candidatus Liptonbacteria bacterium]